MLVVAFDVPLFCRARASPHWVSQASLQTTSMVCNICWRKIIPHKQVTIEQTGLQKTCNFRADRICASQENLQTLFPKDFPERSLHFRGVRVSRPQRRATLAEPSGSALHFHGMEQNVLRPSRTPVSLSCKSHRNHGRKPGQKRLHCSRSEDGFWARSWPLRHEMEGGRRVLEAKSGQKTSGPVLIAVLCQNSATLDASLHTKLQWWVIWVGSTR